MMNNKILIMILVLSGCVTDRKQEYESADQIILDAEQNQVTANKVFSDEPFATTKLQAKNKTKVEGKIDFFNTQLGILLVGEVKNLTPGSHAIHIHENGDCSGVDANAAGGHFNPHRLAHGSPHSKIKHLGDLGNLYASSDGTAQFYYLWEDLEAEQLEEVLSKSVIIHEKSDDFVTQPTGNSGARIACGTFGKTASQISP